MKKDFLSILDLDEKRFKYLIDEALRIKRGADLPEVLKGKHIALVFEKPSLRTRVTFEVAIKKLGGNLTYLAPGDIKLGQRESVEDVGKNLNLWVNGLVARVFKHETLVRLAQVMDSPVINALSDLEHPCQTLADYMTIRELTGKWKVNVVFVGDGNNVATSLMLATAMLGGSFKLACPEGFEPPKNFVEKAMEMAS